MCLDMENKPSELYQGERMFTEHHLYARHYISIFTASPALKCYLLPALEVQPLQGASQLFGLPYWLSQ